MKVLLDSSYLFPALGIDIVEGWSKSSLMNLLESDEYILYYCDLSLFEIYSKSMRLKIQKKAAISINQLQLGIQSILQSSKLRKLNWFENIYESEVVLKLKEIHNDSIDCMLFYLALTNCDIFATFDKTLIEKIRENTDIMQLIDEIHPNIMIWQELLKEKPIKLLIE